MNERAIQKAPAVSVVPAATRPERAANSASAPYIPSFFDRQLDRFIAVAERFMPGLPTIGAALLLAVLAGYAAGVNFASDETTFPADIDASGIGVELSQPTEPAASDAAAKALPQGEVLHRQRASPRVL